MALSTIPFLFGALPIFLVIYYLVRPPYRMYVLLIFSAWFYYVNEPAGSWVAVILLICNYLTALGISICRQKGKVRCSACLLTVGVLGDVLLLLSFKFRSGGQGLLTGQSFFTFTLISYLADVYLGKCRAEKNAVRFADYVLMFPKVIMGPIERYEDVAEGFGHRICLSDIGMGARRFMAGFCKKTILADNLAFLVNEANTDMADASVAALWIGAAAYSLQLFFDFSGYSDMAIGLAQVLGFHLKENFKYPYCCKSVTDFWRRWHISLSEWFRDYVYIPLGGSRRSVCRNILNLLVVWVLTGIWHGNGLAFVAWGLVYFFMLMLERYVIKPQRLGKPLALVWRAVTLLVVNFNWVLFSHSSLRAGLRYCARMVGVYGFTGWADVTDVRILREYGVYLLLGIVFSMPAAEAARGRLEKTLPGQRVLKTVVPLAYMAAFLWGLSFVLLGFHNPFMYQQF